MASMLPTGSLPAITGHLVRHYVGSSFSFTGEMAHFSLEIAEAEIRSFYKSYDIEGDIEKELSVLSGRVGLACKSALGIGVSKLAQGKEHDEALAYMRHFLLSALGNFTDFDTLTHTLSLLADRIHNTNDRYS